MKKVRLTCVRHGQSKHNVQNLIQGWVGSELTELGHKQVQKFAESYIEKPQVIFYSDLNRCRQSVEYITSKYPDIPALADWRLRERSFGKFEGGNKNVIDWDTLTDHDPAKSHRGIEPRNLMGERLKSFLRDLALLDISYALVVTHGGVLNQLKFILDPEHTWTKHVNAESIDIEYSLDDPRIKAGPIPEWSTSEES